MRRVSRSAALLCGALIVLRALPVAAHAVGLSRGDYQSDGPQVRATLTFARSEVLAALPDIDGDRDGMLTAAELDHAHEALAAWIGRGLEVRLPDGGCAGGLERATVTEQDGLALTARYVCPQSAAAFSVRLGLLADLSLGHRHIVTATASPPVQTVHTVLYEGATTVAVGGRGPDAGSAQSAGPSLFRLGVEHILSGYDHLLFLLAVVLIGGPLRSVLAVVTAFTLAHSVTLAVAALGLWTPRPSWVEPAIALSIAYIGIENCVAPDIHRRWRLTFLFGLVHGFGFAGALREIVVSATDLPWALGAFNLGVEAGQLAVLGAILPLVSWLGRRAWFAQGGLRFASLTISAIGILWFVERVSG